MESSPWNEHGIHMGLGEIFDKVPFHMDSIAILPILVILVKFEN